MNFEIASGVKQTGPQLGHTSCRGVELVAPGIRPDNARDGVAVVLHWPGTMEYLTIRGKFQRGSAAWQDFSSEPKLAKMMRFDALITQKRKFLIAQLQFDDHVEFDYEVDTDHESYLALPDQPPGRKLEVDDLKVQAYAAALASDPESNKPRVQWEAHSVTISIGNVRFLEGYAGYVALDLGNTRSTLVALTKQARDLSAIEVIGVERPWSVARPEPVRSALRIRNRLADPKPQTYTPFDCEIGRPAEHGTSGDGLFLGAKRLLADLPEPQLQGTGTIPLQLGGKQITLERREPAELFLAQMLEAFHNQRHAFPGQLVLTCPTTFSGWEVNNLRTAAYHACQRSRALTRNEPGREELRRVIPRMIDEASAAAFYFVFRDFLNGPGRLAGLRYYGKAPRGLNLLLYDCGGGTTDIALVNVVARDAQRVAFRVLGRSGHRDFGGDAMTMAVFRVLKAKIAAHLDNTLALPGDPADITDFLVRREADIDDAVPTRFNGELANLAEPSVRRRREATLLLWRWAERVKVEGLARQTADGDFEDFGDFGQGSAGASTVTPQTEEFQQLAALLGWSLDAVSRLSGGVPVSREEVDVLIRPEVRRTVEYASHLMQSRLPRGQEVDYIYVVGSASQYPLIRETLRHPTEGLPIRDMASRFRDVAEADLKDSVAKGAVLAQWVDREFKGFRVEFDQELMDRLPYDLTFGDISRASNPVLFEENTAYGQLGEATLDVPKPVQGDPNREVRLGRCWPGDVTPRDDLRFEFKQPVVGRVKVWYDTGRRRFAMQPVVQGPNGPIRPEYGYARESSIHDAPPLIGEACWPPINRDPNTS